MAVREFRLKPEHARNDALMDRLAGTRIDAGCIREDSQFTICGEDVNVYKPDGSPLVIFRHNVLPSWVCRFALPSMFAAATPTDARGMAAGRGYHHDVKADGTVSNTRRANEVLSGIVGYYDRKPPRHPHCRMTAYSASDVDGWVEMLPFISAVNDVFRDHCPERHAAQMEAVGATHPYWVIPGTAFTTMTVNRNFRTAVHKDEGDLKEGFGVMAVLERGGYAGGYLMFPKYGVAVDMRERDVILADVHEYHANTPIVGVEGEYDRISTVLYYRTNMRHCLSPAQEYARRS